MRYSRMDPYVAPKRHAEGTGIDGYPDSTWCTASAPPAWSLPEESSKGTDCAVMRSTWAAQTVQGTDFGGFWTRIGVIKLRNGTQGAI